ncbi:MAG: glycosyltransferase family 2 protein [Aquificae bacterium]|nr:glycosyltransferase family 2 protein [Aquificota bacterium]
MEEEKVSVIIPVYNGEKFIKETVNSALNQTHKNTEIIIIDDHSIDNTQKVIFENFKNLIGKKIIYYKNQKNIERAKSRNKGVELSSGRYIFFLDADDKWEKDYIQRVMGIFKEKNPDIVYSYPRIHIDEKEQITKISKKTIPKNLGILIFSANIGYPSATALKKEKFLTYIDRYIPREDWEMFIRSYLKNLKIQIDDNKKVQIREHKGRTSANKCFFYSTMTVFNDYIDKIPKNYLGYFLFHMADTSLRFGEFKIGIKFLKLVLKEKPSLLFSIRNILSILKRLIRVDRLLGFNIKPCKQKRGKDV